MTPGTTISADSTALHVRTWNPDGPRRADAVIVHGLGEHGGRYEAIAEALVEQGLSCHAPDLRGFGRSGGRRAWVHRWSDFVEDVAAVVNDHCHPGRPFVLYGHSMGGLVALSYALSSHRSPARMVLSAPALDADISAAKRLLARILGRVASRASLPNDITGDQLSRDPAVGEAYFADPLVLTRTSAGLGLQFLRGMDAARRSLERLTVPTLVVHGDGDTLVPPEVSEPLAEAGRAERIVVRGARHEWHNEPDAAMTLRTVVSWMLAGL